MGFTDVWSPMPEFPLLPGALLFLAAACGSGHAHAQQNPEQFCRRAGTDDTLRPIPPSLVPEARSMFGPSMPPDMALRTTVFRCAQGQTRMCNTGANLPCGKANTSRNNPGTSTWCKRNPDSPFIPMYAVGHDTVYRWRCKDGQAQIVSQQSQVDERGFIARYWKPLK